MIAAPGGRDSSQARAGETANAEVSGRTKLASNLPLLLPPLIHIPLLDTPPPSRRHPDYTSLDTADGHQPWPHRNLPSPAPKDPSLLSETTTRSAYPLLSALAGLTSSSVCLLSPFLCFLFGLVSIIINNCACCFVPCPWSFVRSVNTGGQENRRRQLRRRLRR